MFKFKKNRFTKFLLYFAIMVFAFLIFYYICNMHIIHNIDESNHIEAFSLRKTFNSQKRKFKNLNKKYISKYTSKINRFFKSVF
jgi:hypothetical protein